MKLKILMKMYQRLPSAFVGLMAFASLFLCLTSCSDDDEPEIENETEIITDVLLTFTGGGEVLTASAQDSDGQGIEDIAVLGDIELKANTTYELAITLENSVANESITEEVENEAFEHMFFFSFTDGIFSNPEGDGNYDDRDDAINYEDKDINDLPLGLETSWTTGDAGTGTFRVVLKHQPDLKTTTSGSTDGESDIDLTWDIVIE